MDNKTRHSSLVRYKKAVKSRGSKANKVIKKTAGRASKKDEKESRKRSNKKTKKPASREDVLKKDIHKKVIQQKDTETTVKPKLGKKAEREKREEERIIPTPAKIFLRIKRLIAKYEPNFEVNADSDVEYSLYAHGKGEVLFAQVSMMGEYVNFKYNPLVLEEDLKNSLNPQLLALLHDDGFHFNDIGIRLEKRILSALKKGFRLYKKLGLI